MQVKGGMQFPEDKAPDTTALQPIAFASMSVISTEVQYSSVEREVLHVLHGLEEFHDYYIACEISVITDHKPLWTILIKNAMSLSHRLQRIILHIHQYNIRSLYEPGPQHFGAIWLSRHKHRIG